MEFQRASEVVQKTVAIYLLCTAALSAPVHAQAVADARADSPWTLGIGGLSIQKAYKDIGRDNIITPIVNYETRWLSIGVPRTDVKLYSSDTLSFRLRARYARDGFDAEDSPYFAGMADRKHSIWMGAAANWNAPWFNTRAEWLADVMGHSKGSRASIHVDRRIPWGIFSVTPRVGIEWYDGDFVDYYYGVRPSESTVARPAYQGTSTRAVEVGVRLEFSPVNRHFVYLDLNARRYGAGIKDSPLVDRATQTSVGLGYLVRF